LGFGFKKIQEDISLTLRGDISNRSWFCDLSHKTFDPGYEIYYFNYFLFNDVIIKINIYKDWVSTKYQDICLRLQ
jgi:hypothetical protein